MFAMRLSASPIASSKLSSTPRPERFTSVSRLLMTVHITSISGMFGMGMAISAVERMACTSSSFATASSS